MEEFIHVRMTPGAVAVLKAELGTGCSVSIGEPDAEGFSELAIQRITYLTPWQRVEKYLRLASEACERDDARTAHECISEAVERLWDLPDLAQPRGR